VAFCGGLDPPPTRPRALEVAHPPDCGKVNGRWTPWCSSATSRGGPWAGARSGFLPTTREEMRGRGWDKLDVLIVTGNACVDHPAFGPVLVARFLEGRGFRVGVIAQPRWDSPDDIARMGRPRLFVGVSAGNLDSMLNKLTAQKKVRRDALLTMRPPEAFFQVAVPTASSQAVHSTLVTRFPERS
jgi:hypothetical protein